MRPAKLLKKSRELLRLITSPFRIVTEIYWQNSHEDFDAWKSTHAAKYEEEDNTLLVLIDLSEGN